MNNTTPTDDEREAHSHEGEARVWCETHQHEHIASMPRFTYLCKDCGWGQWYGDQAREHEFWTQENLREAHVTYEVEHVTRPIAGEPQGEPADTQVTAAWEALNEIHDTGSDAMRAALRAAWSVR